MLVYVQTAIYQSVSEYKDEWQIAHELKTGIKVRQKTSADY